MSWNLVYLAAILLALADQAEAPPDAPQEIRVGLVAYEDFDAEYRQWQRAFAAIGRQHEPPLHFRLAVGTYGDVLHWLRREMIDMAVLTPGVFSESLTSPGPEDQAAGFEYLATVGLPPAVSVWASPERRAAGYHYRYRCVCVVDRASSLKTADDLKQKAELGEVEFLFVHPLSLSGYVAPAFALRALGIEPRREHMVFTHSHSSSLRLAAQGSEARRRVAFVWDDALHEAPELADRLRPLNFPQLDALELPQNVVIARRGFAEVSVLQSLLLSYRDPDGALQFQVEENVPAAYDKVRRWREACGNLQASAEAQRVTLDEIGQILLHSARSQPDPPRLAVVLTGGGAKCSYQVGALAALEEMLGELRENSPEDGLDIALVVGTSGGAINAVPVALGITAEAEGRRDFQRAWKSLDQREIVRPAAVVRFNIGLWFAIVQAGVVLGIVRRTIARPDRRAWTASSLLAALGLVMALLGLVEVRPWSLLGGNHGVHHAWLWYTFGSWTVAWCLTLAGLAGLALQWHLSRRRRALTLPRRQTFWCLTVLLVGLPTVQLVTVLFFQETLSGGGGMEHALAKEFPALVDRRLERSGQSPLGLGGAASDSERLEFLGRQILDRRQLRRDLVITGNCLQQRPESLPSDLYFYAHGSGGHAAEEPQYGQRGVPLAGDSRLLFDVVLGSSSIFPVFPSRTLRDFPAAGREVQLVDGGFAHNSPIEAAVLWGATHIVLLEATPDQRPRHRHFAQNVLAALSHLHKQTQLADVRSKQQVMVFTLTPEAPHLCVLDFADNLIDASIQRGYRDARGESDDGGLVGVPRFRKELGAPVFAEH
ncbi:MAG: patatin-like phospholipase family protein [Pirellulales bacterium]|nr:patatin-like phospholipase family protein [Pirellulales bacterium]